MHPVFRAHVLTSVSFAFRMAMPLPSTLLPFLGQEAFGLSGSANDGRKSSIQAKAGSLLIFTSLRLQAFAQAREGRRR